MKDKLQLILHREKSGRHAPHASVITITDIPGKASTPCEAYDSYAVVHYDAHFVSVFRVLCLQICECL